MALEAQGHCGHLTFVDCPPITINQQPAGGIISIIMAGPPPSLNIIRPKCMHYVLVCIFITAARLMINILCTLPFRKGPPSTLTCLRRALGGGGADVSPAQWSRQEASDRQVVEGTGKEVGDFPFVLAPPAPGQPH